MALRDALTKRYGGIPGWGWAGVAGLGVGAWIFLRNRSASTTDTSTGPVDGTTGGGSGAFFPAPSAPSPASEDCRDRKDPAGRVHHNVCGPGHWRKHGGRYSWVPGTSRRPPPSGGGGGSHPHHDRPHPPPGPIHHPPPGHGRPGNVRTR